MFSRSVLRSNPVFAIDGKTPGKPVFPRFLSSADAIHPFSSAFAHPYYAATESFRERPKGIVVRGASWASFRRRGWRLPRLRGGATWLAYWLRGASWAKAKRGAGRRCKEKRPGGLRLSLVTILLLSLFPPKPIIALVTFILLFVP